MTVEILPAPPKIIECPRCLSLLRYEESDIIDGQVVCPRCYKRLPMEGKDVSNCSWGSTR